MPKVKVTPELSDTLRNLRAQNKIKSRELAKHIGKSPAYITKLEKNGIKAIDLSVLYDILSFIAPDLSYTALAEQIFDTLKIKYSAEEISDQVWYMNYEEVKCLIPIPQSLIEEINEEINELKISRKYLLERINANEALSETEKSDPKFPLNEWIRTETKDNGDYKSSIKIRISERDLNDILDSKKEVCPYYIVRAIVFYLLKIKRYGDTIQLDGDQYQSLLYATTKLLNHHKYYSISEKHRIFTSAAQNDTEVSNLLNSFDNKNHALINDIFSGFKYASDKNIKTANEQLESFAKNMHWDLGFILKLISINFYELGQINYQLKKSLLSDIEALVEESIEKYKNMPTEIKQIETY